MTAIEQALTKLEEIVLKGEEQMTYVSEAIKKADNLISRSAFKYRPLHVEYYKDEDGSHSLALDRASEKGEYRIFYECYNSVANEPMFYRALSETKVSVRFKMFEYLPDFLEKFIQLPYKDQNDNTKSI